VNEIVVHLFEKSGMCYTSRHGDKASKGGKQIASAMAISLSVPDMAATDA
jgi:hypothetical protein